MHEPNGGWHKSYRRRAGVLGMLVLISLAVTGCVAFGALRAAPPTASGLVTAIPLGTVEADGSAEAFPTLPPAWTLAPPADATVTHAEATATVQAEASPDGAASGVDTTSQVVLFRIDTTNTEARFIIGEVLRGEPNIVVGVANQVSGVLAIDFGDIAGSRVGDVQVNARTFVTDEPLRNRAIQNSILQTSDFEYITFSPVSIAGWPETLAFGVPYTLQIDGELKIRDMSQLIMFEVRVTLISEQRLEGLGHATIRREDFGLNIPSVPYVAEVEMDTWLEIDFVALAAE